MPVSHAPVPPRPLNAAVGREWVVASQGGGSTVHDLRLSRNPLEPISTAVGCTTRLLVAALVLGLFIHQAAWGNGPVCTTVSPNDASIFSEPISLPGVATAAHASLSGASICADHPTAVLRAAGLLMAWPYILLWLVFLWRLRGLLKAAAEPGGLYSPATASRLRMLGWLLTLGGVAASIIVSVARIVVFTRLVDYPGLGWFEPHQVSFSFTALITGLTLITVARVMTLGVKMREELDVTV
jgi:hypothetical protein